MKRTALGPVLGLALFGLVASALAQAPSASGHHHGKGFGPHGGPSAGMGHPHGPPGAPMGSAPPGARGSAAAASSGAPGGMAHGLKQRMMERFATLNARRAAHVGELKTRFSELHLKNEALRNELRRHARSVAFLTRARMIAEEELTEPKKAKVLKRIEVLLAKEQSRHDRHVLRFTGVGPAPSGSAPPFASGFVPPRAPSAAGPAGSGAPKRLPPKPAASAGGAP